MINFKIKKGKLSKSEKLASATEQDLAALLRGLTTSEDLDHLTPDGDLPLGWLYANKDFTEEIKGQHTKALNEWIAARKDRSPEALRAALARLIMVLELSQQKSHAKGECFAFWFDSCIADQKYIDKRRAELKDLEANLDGKMQAYEYLKDAKTFEMMILDAIREHDGILQKDLYNLFFNAPEVKNEISEKLYFMAKEGKIERIKHGSTYELHIRQ